MASPRTKKSSIPMILGALLFGAPGAVTFSFAVGEARSYTSDWVYISSPLLLLGSMCVIGALWRLLGRVGLAVGTLLVVAGLGGAWFTLDEKIAEREEHHVRFKALDETQKFCERNGRTDGRARPYDSAQPGLYPTTVFRARESKSWESSYDKAYSKWRPKPYHIQEAALVACVDQVPQPLLERCQYTEGRSLDRIRTDVDVKLYAIKTGELVFETVIEGGMPRECEGVEKFYGDYKDSIIAGEVPTAAAIADILRPHIERE